MLIDSIFQISFKETFVLELIDQFGFIAQIRSLPQEKQFYHEEVRFQMAQIIIQQQDDNTLSLFLNLSDNEKKDQLH